jgi:HK97 family phage major capsid protein
MSEKHIVDSISEARARAWEEAKATLDVAAAEGRDLSAEEAEKFDRINKELDELDARRKGILDAIERDKAIEESRARMGVGGLLAGDPEPEEQDDNAQIRALLDGKIRGARFEKRAISKSNAYGATPTSVYGSIVEHLVQANPLRDVATLITTQSGENLNVPTTSAFSTASIVGEGSQASTSDPTFVNSRVLGAYKYVVLVQLSNELALDAGVDVAGFLGRQAGTAIGVATRGHMTTGDGSSKPYGIVTNSTAGVTGGTGVSGKPSVQNIIDLYHSVTAPYRLTPNCGWMMSSSTLGKVRSLRADSGTYGSYDLVFKVGLEGNADTILGKPVYVNESTASTATSAKSILFGAMDRYYIREVNGIDVAISDDFAFDYSVRTFRVTLRTDGVLIDQTGAVKHFVGGAS